jgi:hypothetical protein
LPELEKKLFPQNTDLALLRFDIAEKLNKNNIMRVYLEEKKGCFFRLEFCYSVALCVWMTRWGKMEKIYIWERAKGESSPGTFLLLGKTGKLHSEGEK